MRLYISGLKFVPTRNTDLRGPQLWVSELCVVSAGFHSLDCVCVCCLKENRNSDQGQPRG
jgi:hypothetical protein